MVPLVGADRELRAVRDGFLACVGALRDLDPQPAKGDLTLLVEGERERFDRRFGHRGERTTGRRPPERPDRTGPELTREGAQGAPGSGCWDGCPGRRAAT